MNEAVSYRQALGGGFTRTDIDLHLAKAVRDGVIKMPPHPEWRVPGTITWDEDPFGQENWKFQLHTLRWLDPLRRVSVSLAGHDPNGRARHEWVRICSSWMDHCLFAKHPVAWKDMAVGVRTIELVLGYPLVPKEEQGRFLECIKIHARHLANPRNHARGNHLLHQLQGLYVAAKFLGDERLEESAIRHLAALLAESFDDEGVNAEGALGYHDMNIQWWGQVATRLRREQAEIAGLDEVLFKARECIVHGVRPDLLMETIGDTGVDKRLVLDRTPEARFARSGGRRGRAPREVSRCFDAGYAFGRSGWGESDRAFRDETFYSLRFGPDKSMHGHRDSTSVTLYSRGVPWIVDPGLFAYGQSEMREFMCSRPAHNVVVDLRRPNHPNRDPRLLSRRSTETHDSYVMETSPSPMMRVRRAFVYHRIADVAVVVDRVWDSEGASPAHARQLWHVGAGVEVTTRADGVRLFASGESADVTWVNAGPLDVVSGERNPLQGWVTSGYGKAEPAPVVSVMPTGPEGTPLCAAVSWGNGRPTMSLEHDGDTVDVLIELASQVHRVTLDM